MDPLSSLLHTRTDLQAQANVILRSLDVGETPARAETERVDCKEEAGRRGRDGTLLPGERRNQAAAEQLSSAVCCLANTPGGGALIVGVQDQTWSVLGTELDEDWLRQRIYQLVDIAPAIEVHYVGGQRVLVLFVSESPEPVEDQDRKIRWRVGDSCVPTDRSEWWLKRQNRGGIDPMAVITAHTVADVQPGAAVQARRYLAEVGDDLSGVRSDTELLRRLGVVSADDRLTAAGVIAFCAADRSLVTLTRIHVPGGNITGSFVPPANQSLLEQIAAIESRLDAYNPAHTQTLGLAETDMRALPVRAVREALLNGIVHRDWMVLSPTTATWIEADSRLEVVSPGGFMGGITANNILSRRFSRYPALTDLFRALRLVERQGIGVDRMYREMIVLGHRPPFIEERSGPEVKVMLAGGQPVMPVVKLITAIRPQVRQRDVNIAVLVYHLLHKPFITRQQTADALQTNIEESDLALGAAEQTTVNGEPLVVKHADVWRLGKTAIAEILRNSYPTRLAQHNLLTYYRASGENAEIVVKEWLQTHSQITSGDFAALTGIAGPNATRTLNGLIGSVLIRGEATRGRNAHFLPMPDRRAAGSL